MSFVAGCIGPIRFDVCSKTDVKPTQMSSLQGGANDATCWLVAVRFFKNLQSPFLSTADMSDVI